jgi:hypothetical protein
VTLDKYVIKLIRESEFVSANENDRGSGGVNETFIIEKNGIEVLKNPSKVGLADWLQREFAFDVCETERTFTQKWWSMGEPHDVHCKCKVCV